MEIDKKIYNRVRKEVSKYNIKGREDNEDLVQDCILKLWSKGRHQGLIPLLVRNTIFSFFRTKQNNPQHWKTKTLVTRDPLDVEDLNYYSFEPGIEFELDEYIGNIPKGRLNENYKRPLRLHILDELQYDEIARLENIPIGTAKSRVHRGRKQLQEILLTFGQPPKAVRGVTHHVKN